MEKNDGLEEFSQENWAISSGAIHNKNISEQIYHWQTKWIATHFFANILSFFFHFVGFIEYGTKE